VSDINDFKIIAQKSRRYFSILEHELNEDFKNLDDAQKERFGFYLYMLENLCGEKEIFDLVDIVTDTEFNKILFKENINDYGVDAIHINEEYFCINLFNFKYRNKFNSQKRQSLNETILSTKFINALINENAENLDGKIKSKAEKIISKLVKSGDIWHLKLFIVSNDLFELDKTDDNIAQLEKLYGLEVIPIGLAQINKIMSIRPKPINAEILVDKDAIMSYTPTSISSLKSYVVRLSLCEVVRITCNNEILRKKYNIENIKELKDVDIDYSVLFDNVRGLVLKSKFNENISNTLKEDYSRFFMFNNGLTITAKDIEATAVNANKFVKLNITELQVLNGGQTLRIIHSFNKEDSNYIEDYLSKSEILVRLFKTSSNEELSNKIAEYTNSQNSISNIDLKSLRTEQIQLEQFLDENNIIYSRKAGDTGLSETKEYKHKISMEKFGQILFALKGYPYNATNQKKQLFDKFYDEIFSKTTLKIEESPRQIEKYFEIKKKYENHQNQYNYNDQKALYIVYLESKVTMDIEKIIEKFEKAIIDYTPANNTVISDARKLIQLNFKNYLDGLFCIK